MENTPNTWPDTAESLFFAASEYLAEGDWARAKAGYQACLAADPQLAEAHANLGFILEHEGEVAAAEAQYAEACRLAPEHPLIRLNYGALLAAGKRFTEAEACYRHGLRIDSLSTRLWSNLGIVLACTHREAEAETCYRNALAIDPEARSAQFNLAYLLLRQGRYEEGWQRFEARDWYEPLARLLPYPRWQGNPLSGQRILVTLEAGHGDVIQFSRYCRHLKQAGAHTVALMCQPGLKRLFAHFDGVDRVLSPDEIETSANTAYDHWVPLLSLPYWFRTTLDTIPAPLPYLAADPGRLAHWAAHLPPAGPRLRVGLVWRGNPAFENDADRSLPSLSTLAPLWSVPHVDFFSLQKGANEAEADTLASAYPITPLGGQIEDFADTAAILMQLDLLITVDTAVAHLAGALGRPCWLLLPDFKTDWRWLTARTDSPWYPGTLRLFRQHTAGDWATPVTEVLAALHVLAGPRP